MHNRGRGPSCTAEKGPPRPLARCDAAVPSRGGVRQPVHRDASLLSLNIALSEGGGVDYAGGGTYFEGIDFSQQPRHRRQTRLRRAPRPQKNRS